MDCGWIKLHRKITDNPMWKSEPFTKSQAWIDLILLANFKRSYFYKRGIRVDIERGQLGRSEVELSDRWKWSRTKVRRFLNVLENEHQIEKVKNNLTLIVTIKNYDEYQSENTKEHQSGQQKDSKVDSKRYTLEESKEKKDIPCSEIIDFLNEKTSKEYKATSQKTKGLIIARLNEKFTVDDFKKVIMVKTKEWLNTDNDKYLRPETLFGSKFEGYLNQYKPPKTNKPVKTYVQLMKEEMEQDARRTQK